MSLNSNNQTNANKQNQSGDIYSYFDDNSLNDTNARLQNSYDLI